MKLRLFISSVQDEFAAERRKLKDWLTSDPFLSRFIDAVFLFEDAPSSGKSPADRYLDEVRKSDIYVGILGSQYYGKKSVQERTSATELEYDAAGAADVERLVYVKACDERDPREEEFVRKVNNDVTRTKFSTFENLRSALYSSLVEYLDERRMIVAGEYDRRICDGATLDDISRETVEWFIDEANSKSRNHPYRHEIDTSDFLLRFKLISGEKLTNGALLLFGKDPQSFYPSVGLKCVWCEGMEYKRPFLDFDTFHGNIFSLIQKGVSFVFSRLARSRGLRTMSLNAPVKFDLPREAVVEALTNALVHRNYYSHGSAELRLFSDRLEVWNPGRLPDGITIDELYKTHASYPVNFILTDVVSHTATMDSSGTGIERMIDACRCEGVPDPEFEQRGPSFVVTFPFDNWTDIRMNAMGLTSVQKEVVKLLKKRRRLSASDLIETIGLPRRTASRLLRELVDKDILLVNGNGKFTSYTLKFICATYAPNETFIAGDGKKSLGNACNDVINVSVGAGLKAEKNCVATLKTTPETTPKTTPKNSTPTSLGDVSKAVLSLIERNPGITRAEIALTLGLTRDGVRYHIDILKHTVGLRYVGSSKTGHWEIDSSRIGQNMI